MKNLSLLLLLICLFVSSCGNYHRIFESETEKSEQNLGEDLNVDFAFISATILEPKCINCHTGRHNAYRDYQIVKASAQGMLERIKTQNSALRMPRGMAPLTEQEVQLFERWVDNGAPQFASDEPSKEEKGPEPSDLISFEQIKQRILKPYNCTACHSQFNDFASVKKSLGSIISLISSNQMPFPRVKNTSVQPVSNEDKKFLDEWVAQGSPELSNGQSPNLNQEPLKPTWVSLRNQVLGPKCILCHNAFGNRGAGLNLGRYRDIQQAMITNPNLINLSSPNDSHLIGAILGRVDDDEFFFDPMPFNNTLDDVDLEVPAVTEDELNVLRQWIELGLPFNDQEFS